MQDTHGVRQTSSPVLWLESMLTLTHSRLYLLFALRPLLAFNAASSAMNDILCLLHFRNDGHDEYFQEAIHRAYWTCFIILQELKLNVSFSTASLHYFRTVVPLPVSDHDEPGMFFFLSEVALRRICNSVQDSVFDINITYPPAVPDELITQLAQWYAGLPAAVSFPLDASVILDGHRAFLRAQYYSVLCVLHWSAVVRFLIQEPEDPRERERLLQSGARALEYAMLYISSSETLLLDRHVLLLANLNGYAPSLLIWLCPPLCSYYLSCSFPSILNSKWQTFRYLPHSGECLQHPFYICYPAAWSGRHDTESIPHVWTLEVQSKRSENSQQT